MHMKLKKIIQKLKPPMGVELMIAALQWNFEDIEIQYDPRALGGFPLTLRSTLSGSVSFDYQGNIVRDMSDGFIPERLRKLSILQ